MPRYRCKSCSGEYLDPQADGVRYFHVCPEERVEEIPGELDGDGNPRSHRVPIPNRRDERPLPPGRDGKPQLDATGAFRITAPGLGRVILREHIPDPGDAGV